MRVREPLFDETTLTPRAIDNSQIVRERDPRSNRDLWLLLVLVAAMVGAFVLYAWPSVKLRQTAQARAQMSRERERLLEENRKLRLEKASLENLRRIESIAVKDLGLLAPAPDQVVVVERPRSLPEGSQVAAAKEPAAGVGN
ncbi:MAG TPA: cell division protein FtsL [Vicinamibacteria bacterium]|nr:cell division protein FtsL [Vicinamibacteria bacterium]